MSSQTVFDLGGVWLMHSHSNSSLPKIETRSLIQCPQAKRLTRQNVPSKLLQVHRFRLKEGLLRQIHVGHADLLRLTIYCSSHNFHSTCNGNGTWGIGIIVFQQFWTTGSFATIDSCAAVEVVQKATFLPCIPGAFCRCHGA